MRAVTRLVASVVALGALVGCQRAMPIAPIAPAAGFRALADFPAVDRQIDRARVGITEFGTLVRELPRLEAGKASTFLTYKALDNNLAVTMPDHLNQLERAGSSQSLNVLAYTDDVGPKNTHRYYIRQDAEPDRVTSPYQPAGRWDLNTGSGKTLEKAVRWAFGSYPSRFRWLDINAHGGGYYGIASDDRSEAMIRLPALARAIGAGTGGSGVDLLSFDACLMATVEVAYEVRGVAKVMVASEDISYALGMNMNRTLAAIANDPAPAADRVARSLVLRAERKGELKALYTISAVDLGQADRLARALDALAGALMAAMPNDRAAIERAVAGTPAFHVAGADQADYDHRDLSAFIEQLRRRVPDAGVFAAAQAAKEALHGRDGAVFMTLAAEEEGEAAGGLSIYLPAHGSVDARYRETAFARETRWDEFLAALGRTAR